MRHLEGYGLHRSLEPLNSLPQPAWKLDNNMTIRDSEILIKVEIININSVSFKQIIDSAGGDKEKISEKILEIIDERGKLHNPVTGTGGMFYGEVEKIGPAYPNKDNIEAGAKVISLASLSLTPLVIDKIIDIDLNFAQLQVEGRAVLFASVPLTTAPQDIPLKFLIATLDEAGAPANTYNIAKKSDTILVMGAESKTGLLCAYAAKKKIGRTGKLYAMCDCEESRILLEKYNIFIDIIICDASNTSCAFETALERSWDPFDTIINCVTHTGSEMTGLTLVKDHGTIFFPGLGHNYKMTALMAEGVGKDVTIIPYKGYSTGHAEFTINLLKNKNLKQLLNKTLKKNITPQALFTEQLKKAEENIVKNYDLDGYIFTSGKMREVYESAIRVSQYNCTVMLSGESGVGKEVVAHIIHTNSERSIFPQIKINCASIPEGLLESELFGYEKGAFTGANSSGKIGFFEMAQNGTLFLDEIGELPLNLQGKLLRVLQDQEIYRIGGTKPIKINVRIITATNKDLEEMVEKKQFRPDLYYRLNVFPIEIPPLRQRKDDIVPLLKMFVERYSMEFGIKRELDGDVLGFFSNYDWPGNIREVQNFVQRLLINAKSDVISMDDIPDNFSDVKLGSSEICESNFRKTMLDTEYRLLFEAKNNHPTSRLAAKALGISQSSYIKKLQKHSLS